MSWKWYEITDYSAMAGGGDYYGDVQLMGESFYALLKFRAEGPLPDAIAPTTYGQRFYGFLEFQQMPIMVDLLRNEGPLHFDWVHEHPNHFQLTTFSEPVGEGDGTIAPDSPERGDSSGPR